MNNLKMLQWVKSFNGDLRTINIVKLFKDAGLYRFPSRESNKHSVSCPWEHEHSTPDSRNTVILWAPEGKIPSFKCLHQSHQNKSIQDVLTWFGKGTVEQACDDPFTHLRVEQNRLKQQKFSTYEDVEETTPQLPSFPLDVFPPTVQEIVRAYANSVNAPVDIAAVQSLAITSLALGPNWIIEAKSFRRPSRLWLAVVAPPENAKTPVMMEPVERRENYLWKLWKSKLAEWNKQQSQKKQNKNSEVSDDFGKSRPLQSHTKTNDFNIDALLFYLAQSPQGMILDVNELTQLFRLIKQSNTRRNGWSRGAFLSMWSGKNVSVLRKTTDSLLVEKPYVIVCGGTQPDTLNSLGLIQGDGMVQCFLWSYPVIPKEVKDYGEKVPVCIKRLWENTIYNAFFRDFGLMQASDKAISFGDSAIKEYNRRKNKMNEIGLSAFAAMYAKAPDHLHRLIACLHGMDHLFENKPAHPVELDVFVRAKKLLDYFLVHSKHCISLAMTRKSHEGTFQFLHEKDKNLVEILKDKERDYESYVANVGMTRQNSTGMAEREQRRKMSASKMKITIRLDSEVLEQFKELANGKDYQNLINQALKEWLSVQGVKELLREELTGLVAEVVGYYKDNEDFVR